MIIVSFDFGTPFTETNLPQPMKIEGMHYKKLKEYIKKQFVKNEQTIKEQYREDNKEHYKEDYKEYYKNNKEKLR